jgi:5-formyltetrahydrofolate cyclo-ligase
MSEPLFPKDAEDYLRRKMKIELRKRMRGVRNAAPASACLARSERIVERLLALDCVAQAKAVALFYPIEDKHEVDLRGLDAALRARGVRLGYPAIAGGDGSMTFRWVDDLARLEEQGYGFAEPPLDAPEATAFDVVVVPALAVDGRGHRIGYGAGYYDRALPRFVPPAVSVIVAFDYQLVSEVPVTEGDVPAHWIVTDERAERATT